MAIPSLVGADGVTPLRAGAMAAAYRAADRAAPELSTYNPSRGSADSDLLPEREDLVAASRDHGRNDGWVSGGIQRYVDSVLGAHLRLQSRPDHRALGITVEEAQDLGRQIETAWKRFAHHPGRWADAARQTTLPLLFGRAFRHRIVDGEALAVMLWRPDRVRPGRARYATCVQLLDPDRLSNPGEGPDTDTLRAGVEIDEEGAAVAYHIRRAHPGDAVFSGVALNAWQWDRVERETDWGRPVVIHDFAVERAGQHRGKPPLAPVVSQLRMVTRASDLELQTFVRDALLGAFITSPYDPELVETRIGEGMTQYQGERLDYHSRNPVRLNGFKVPVLFPGERPELLAPTRPSSGFPSFLQAFLRHIASAMGLSYEQLSQDWSGVNYSSARAALLEVWRGFAARREEFTQGVIVPVYFSWLEEAMDIGDVVPPRGCASLHEEPTAWLSAKWTGPGRGWVDPQKEAAAAILRLQAGLSTLEQECADQGLDYEEVLHQRRRELDLMEQLRLPAPSWIEVAALSAGIGHNGGPPLDE